MPDYDCTREELFSFVKKDLLGKATVTGLIRGRTLGGEYTVLEDDGSVAIYSLTEGADDTAELIDNMNDASPGFMGELDPIHVPDEKLAQIRARKADESILTENEKRQSLELVESSIALSIAYADSSVIYKPDLED